MTNEELIVLAHAGDKEAENQLFIQNKKLIYHFANRFRKRHLDYDTLIGVAEEGFLNAIRMFDPNKGVKLTTLAGFTIRSKILKALRIPQKHRCQLESFDKVLYHDKDGSDITLEDMLGEEDSSFEKLETSDSLRLVLQEFNKIATDREKEFLCLRIEEEMKQDDIAKVFGISQVQVSRIEKKVYAKLRKIAQNHGLQGNFIKGEVRKMGDPMLGSFIYLTKNYPDLKCKDMSKILGVHPSMVAQFTRWYGKGKYDDVLPEPGDLDERVAGYIREHYPEQLSGPVTTTKLEEDVEVKLKPVEQWNSIKEHYEAKQELSERFKIPEETLKETKKIIAEALEQPLPMVGMFPGKFEQLGREIGALVDKKNVAYGDSFAKTGDFLRLLYPNGIKPEQYMDALSIVRVWDKLKRIATDKDAFGENPWQDVAGYSLLGVANSGR